MSTGFDLAQPGTDHTVTALATFSPACVGYSRPMVRPLITTFRACELCSHATAGAGRLLCNSPAARLAGGTQALEVARAAEGSCGPNARHLDMPAWH